MHIKPIYLIALTAFSIIASSCGGKKSSEDPVKTEEAATTIVLTKESQKDIGLETETVVPGPFEGTLIIPATVTANQDRTAQVGSLVHGRVRNVLVSVGSHVRAGQVLMYVEGLEIGEIKAAYMKAKAHYDLAKAEYERQKKLFEQDVSSQQTFLTAKTEYEEAVAVFRAEDRKVHSIGLSDDDVLKEASDHTAGALPVRSPITGVVAERNVVIGQYIEAATTAFTVINTSSIWIDGQVNEGEVDHVGTRADVVFTSALITDGVRGRIINIGQVVGERTRSITVRAEFANPQGRLRPQMYGELRIPVEPKGNALTVPLQALVRETNGCFVFVRTSDTTFVKTPVTVGAESCDRVEITQGIREGDKVVTNGSFLLKSEMKKDAFAEEE